MKHIKDYRLFEDYDSDLKLLQSLINKYLISDLKELSMDFIDDDYTLIIDFVTSVGSAGYLEINHSGGEVYDVDYFDSWLAHNSPTDSEIKYEFSFFSYKENEYVYLEEFNQILKDISIMYPNEEIKMSSYFQEDNRDFFDPQCSP